MTTPSGVVHPDLASNAVWKLLYHDEKHASRCFQASEAGAVQLEEYLELRHLQRMMRAFHQNEDGERSTMLNLENFSDLVADVLGTRHFDDQLRNLFTKLDMSGDGYVDWNDFCTYLLLQLREKDFIQTKSYARFDSDHKIRHSVYNRQEITSKVLSIDNPLRFITLSKEGSICQWDKGLHLTKHIPLVAVDENSRSLRPRVRMWASDCVYMPNCRKLAVATTGRDLRFYDVTSSNTYNEEFYLYGLSDVPLCLHYWYEKSEPGGKSMLIFGDDDGSIQIFTFFRPTVQLFNVQKKRQECAHVFMQELSQQHSRHVKHTSIEHVHPESVNRVRYVAENTCVISSCLNHQNSLVIMDIKRKNKSYIFNLSKGVQCFDHSRSLNVLVTGSLDHRVRVWNPYVPAKPTAILDGHTMGIVDVVLHEQLTLAISLSKDNALKVWDLKELVCIQNISLKFPSKANGKLPEHGFFALCLHRGAMTRLVVAANDYLALLRLEASKTAIFDQPFTHLDQLCCAVYNPHFKQVVTAADDSTVAVWDLETGRKSMVFANAHGQEEITCVVLDETWRRIITGAQNGTIKIWNMQNGHCLKHLEATDDAEVTGLIPLVDRKVIISAGWNRKIITYDDSHPENQTVVGDANWQGGQVHKDDILSAAYLPPSILATASYDGAIYVWALETQKVYVCLRKAPRTRVTAKERQCSRPNSRHRKNYKVASGGPTPVDKLLFLCHRGQTKTTPSAILLSSEAGNINWWSLTGQQKQRGYFYAAEDRDESVLAMATDAGNTILITGDTKGHISVWDIKHYCISADTTHNGEKPPRLAAWLGHDSALVSVEHVQHDTGSYVVTASTDQTCRLWTLHGCCVGLFGQKSLWNLRILSTWQDQPHKDDIYSSSNGNQLNGSNGNNIQVIPTIVTDDTTASQVLITTIPELSASNSDHLTRDTTLPHNTLQVKTPEVVKDRLEVSLPSHNPRSNTQASTVSDISPEAVFARQRPKTILGWKVEQHLTQRQKDRQERRQRYGEIKSTMTTRMGQCTPYRALNTLNIDDLEMTDKLYMMGPPKLKALDQSENTDSMLRLDLSLLTKRGDQEKADISISSSISSGRLPQLQRTGTQVSVASSISSQSTQLPMKSVSSSATTPSH